MPFVGCRASAYRTSHGQNTGVVSSTLHVYVSGLFFMSVVHTHHLVVFSTL
jgi:hypothetical protein